MNSVTVTTNSSCESHEINALEAIASGAGLAALEEVEQSTQQETLAPLDYQQMIRLAQSGDVSAFDELIRRHHAECLKRAMHIMRNLSDAKDQVQNAYCKAWTSIGQFRAEGPFGAWLTRIVENQCLMTFRRPRASFLRLESPSETNVQIELISQDMTPEDRLGAEEVIHVMRTEIRKLPPILRNIVTLYDLRGFPLSEVASQLGISVPAAKSRLSRARLELRSRIEKHVGKKGPASLTQRAVFGQTAYSFGVA